MFPTLDLFGASIPVAPFSIIIGIWIGLSVTEKYASKFNLSADTIYNLVFYSLIAGLLGARLTYILLFPDVFIQNPISIISVNLGLFDLSGGIAFAIIFAIYYAQKNDLDFVSTLDGLTLFFATMAIAISFSNFASGNSYGAPTDLPWSINLWGANRHPTQMYSLIGSALIFWKLIPAKKLTLPNNGIFFIIFIILTSTLHIFISSFIGNPLVLINNFRTIQIWWFVVLSISLYLLNKLYKINSHL